MPTPATLKDIEWALAAPRSKLRFAPDLEEAFHADTGPERLGQILVASSTAVVLYNLFLINDWVALGDRFEAVMLCRLGIFTPCALAAMALFYVRKSVVLAEAATIFLASLGVLLPMAVMISSTSVHRLSYQYGSILVMMFATMIQRMHFRAALVALVLMVSIQLTADYLSRAFDAPTYLGIVSFFLAAATLDLVAVYFWERSVRRTYLLQRRAQLLQEQLRESAQIDALTGLFNRHHLVEVSETLWARAPRRSVGAILLDVDHFKLFNDSYGHIEGDHCLRAMAACVREVLVGTEGTAFRYGGEEMLILLPGATIGVARLVAQRIRLAIAALAIGHPARGPGAIVSASFGVAAGVPADIPLLSLVREADTALYRAKEAGRDCVRPAAGADDARDAPVPRWA